MFPTAHSQSPNEFFGISIELKKKFRSSKGLCDDRGQRDECERKKGQKGWAWLSQCKECVGFLFWLFICSGVVSVSEAKEA